MAIDATQATKVPDSTKPRRWQPTLTTDGEPVSRTSNRDLDKSYENVKIL
jgi:hypothetical protein